MCNCDPEQEMSTREKVEAKLLAITTCWLQFHSNQGARTPRSLGVGQSKSEKEKKRKVTNQYFLQDKYLHLHGSNRWIKIDLHI